MGLLDFFILRNTSSRIMAPRSTQSVTEMSTRNLLGGKVLPARKADTSPPSMSRLSRENVGASTSHNPVGLHGLLQG
jgi:hypothetical protein